MPALQQEALLSVRRLEVSYSLAGGQRMQAVDSVDFDIAPGQTLALVGESGCGKSSVARAVMQITPVAGGTISLQGRDLAALSRAALKQERHKFQMIFQDPISSLNPQRRVRAALEAPLRVNGRYAKATSAGRIHDALEMVGLDAAAVLDRYPHEFSGGQCQRLSIARALLLDPVLLVCDEPVSALDVSVRAQVLNVLNELRRRLALGMLFISHDLAVVRNVADAVAVMFLGRIVEMGPADQVLRNPAHPYTAALLSAVPEADPAAKRQRIVLKGEMPTPLDLPSGCRFRTRCPAAQARCAAEDPLLQGAAGRHQVACFFPFSGAATATAGQTQKLA
jgi:peptide/nickel transport system ATP-binding protein